MAKIVKTKPEKTKTSNKKAVTTAGLSSASKEVREPQTMEELLSQVDYPIHGYKRGDPIAGKIASINGREVRIDFGGKMEGIVGEKEWDLVKDFVSKLKVGDPVDAIVISGENDKGQMIVSIKKAGAKFRWQHADELLKTGDPATVKGLEVNKGGIIVDFEGVRGFVPGSQLSVEHQSDINKLVNRSFQVKVIEVDQKQNRLIFSEKAISGAADLVKKLEDIKSKVKIGEKYQGKVSAIMPYGVFVNLEAGPDGLVHISEISWQKVDNINDYFKLGAEVEVLVLGINENDGKLNLSIKQLLPDPWIKLSQKYSTDQEISGTVTRISPYGVFVELEDGIEGLIHISKVPPEAIFNPKDDVKCTIESIDLSTHRISLVPVLTFKPVGYK